MGAMRRRLRKLEDADAPRLRGGCRQEEPRNEGAEELFDRERQRHLEGDSGLVYDSDEQAFYSSGGELALSRTYANLVRLFDSL